MQYVWIYIYIYVHMGAGNTACAFAVIFTSVHPPEKHSSWDDTRTGNGPWAKSCGSAETQAPALARVGHNERPAEQTGTSRTLGAFSLQKPRVWPSDEN